MNTTTAVTPLSIDAATLKAALQRWAQAIDLAAPELNAQDGKLGDGDLGATLQKCAANVIAALPAMPDQLAAILKACAQACANASGSSFGTLLAVAFLTASKSVATRARLDRAAIAALLGEVLDALRLRGGAKLGDKTMLDSIEAVIEALNAAPDNADATTLKAGTLNATTAALDRMRQQPNRIGRARMFAQQSIGMDDPGMVAVQRMAAAL